MRRMRAFELHHWLLLSYVTVIFGCAIWMAVLAVDSFRATYGGVAGAVTVEDCVYADTEDGPQWTCSGPFVSADGAVRIDAVKLTPRYGDPWEDGATVTGRVSSPTAGTLHTDGRFWMWATGFTVLFLGIGVYHLRSALRIEREVATPPVDPELAAISARARAFLIEWEHVLAPSTPAVAAPAPVSAVDAPNERTSPSGRC